MSDTSNLFDDLPAEMGAHIVYYSLDACLPIGLQDADATCARAVAQLRPRLLHKTRDDCKDFFLGLVARLATLRLVSQRWAAFLPSARQLLRFIVSQWPRLASKCNTSMFDRKADLDNDLFDWVDRNELDEATAQKILRGWLTTRDKPCFTYGLTGGRLSLVIYSSRCHDELHALGVSTAVLEKAQAARISDRARSAFEFAYWEEILAEARRRWEASPDTVNSGSLLMFDNVPTLPLVTMLSDFTIEKPATEQHDAVFTHVPTRLRIPMNTDCMRLCSVHGVRDLATMKRQVLHRYCARFKAQHGIGNALLKSAFRLQREKMAAEAIAAKSM